jgi:hypothetical protein
MRPLKNVQFCSRPRKAKILTHRNTLSILRINPPKFGGGLKFEPDTGIGQKRTFFKGLGVSAVLQSVMIT